jgi:hypothetical protein
MRLIFLIATSFFCLAAVAFPNLKISREPSCTICAASPVGSEASITLKEEKGTIHVGVTSFSVCQATLSEPKISQLSSSATIVVTSEAISTHSGCDAVIQQEFAISGLYPRVKTIYYVQNGAVLGHIALR